jgi:hypothetical protein
MKPKATQDAPTRSPLHARFDAPIYVGRMLDSAQKSSQGTHPTDRSSSRNKVMIPHSPKLANFFSATRARSAQKSLSITSIDATVKREDAQRPKKI